MIEARAGAMYSTTTLYSATTKSSRVPGPTVDRRVSINSGAARMGATKLCLDMCVLTRTRNTDVSSRVACLAR